MIIAGLDRVGQIVARILRMQGIAFTALEKDSEQVEQVRRFGTKVFFGDPSRTDVLRAAGADKARLLVLALGDVEREPRDRGHGPAPLPEPQDHRPRPRSLPRPAAA